MYPKVGREPNKVEEGREPLGFIINDMENTEKQFDMLLKGFGDFQFEINLSSDSIEKLDKLKESGRDFLKITDKMVNVYTEALEKALGSKEISDEKDIENAQKKACEAVAEFIASRIMDGPEYSVKPNTKNTVRMKGNSKVGYDSGDLYNDLKSATIKILK